jgi:hypothetical protein
MFTGSAPNACACAGCQHVQATTHCPYLVWSQAVCCVQVDPDLQSIGKHVGSCLVVPGVAREDVVGGAELQTESHQSGDSFLVAAWF